MRCPTSPPVHDSTVASVTRPLEHNAPTRAAISVRSARGSSATLPPLRPGRWRGRREEPGLAGARLAERPERGAVEREGGRARRARPDLDPVMRPECERSALAEDLARSACRRVDLAVHPDLDPRPAVLRRDD